MNKLLLSFAIFCGLHAEDFQTRSCELNPVEQILENDCPKNEIYYRLFPHGENCPWKGLTLEGCQIAEQSETEFNFDIEKLRLFDQNQNEISKSDWMAAQN
jgi:hypothetical protein